MHGTHMHMPCYATHTHMHMHPAIMMMAMKKIMTMMIKMIHVALEGCWLAG